MIILLLLLLRNSSLFSVFYVFYKCVRRHRPSAYHLSYLRSVMSFFSCYVKKGLPDTSWLQFFIQLVKGQTWSPYVFFSVVQINCCSVTQIMYVAGFQNTKHTSFSVRIQKNVRLTFGTNCFDFLLLRVQ